MTAKERKKLDSYYRRKYGVDYSFYEAKWKAQGEVCALCYKEKLPGQRRFSLDHNHKTGRIRQILCLYCNKYRVGKLDSGWALRIYNYLKFNDS